MKVFVAEGRREGQKTNLNSLNRPLMNAYESDLITVGYINTKLNTQGC